MENHGLTLTAPAGDASKLLFEVSAADLQGAGQRTLYLDRAVLTTPTIIKVVGEGVAKVALNDVYFTGPTGAVPPWSDDFGAISQNILWNFPQATQVDLAGYAQYPGSVLVENPHSTTTFAAPGLNGRVWVAGDLVQNYAGSEFHNFPLKWVPELGCEDPATPPTPAVGGFDLAKAYEGIDADQIPVDTTFQVKASWADADGNVVERAFDLPSSGDVVEGPRDLPVGTEVLFSEVVDSAVEGVDGYTWKGVSFTQSQIVVDEGEAALITATNTYEAEDGTPPTDPDLPELPEVPEIPGLPEVPEGPGDPTDPTDPADPTDPTDPVDPTDPTDPADPVEPATGGFDLKKLLAGMTEGDLRADEHFLVRALVTLPDAGEGQAPEQAQFEVPADGTLVEGLRDLPAGSVVQFIEATPRDPEGHDWTGVTFTQSQVVIEEGEVVEIELTNTYVPEEVAPPTDPEDPADPEDPTDPVDPTDPTDPEDPIDPTDPVGPEDPGEIAPPSDPNDPAAPEDPADPSDPSDPSDPEQPGDVAPPADPSDSSVSGDGDGKKKTPGSVLAKTGASVGIVAALAGLSAIGGSLLLIRTRRSAGVR